MKKGTVILISFPFTDLRGSKVRPAIVLNKSELDVTVCFVTSELKWKTEYDFLVFPSETNGLKMKSLIRSSKIVSINSKLVIGVLGELSESEIEELNICLKNLLQL